MFELKKKVRTLARNSHDSSLEPSSRDLSNALSSDMLASIEKKLHSILYQILCDFEQKTGPRFELDLDPKFKPH